MNLQQIKTAVLNGQTVCVGTDYYIVTVDNKDQWFISCTINNHKIGLTWLDGVTLNDDESNFYIKGFKVMEAIKVKSFRSDYVTLARRLLAVNGYHKNDSYNPHNVRAFILSNEYGVFCVAIGSCLQEALDNAVDNGCLDCMLIHDRDDINEDTCHLGNASEPFDLTYLTVQEVGI